MTLNTPRLSFILCLPFLVFLWMSGCPKPGSKASDPKTCHNEVLDADESDLDCGGPCAACEEGLACRRTADCLSGRCERSICASSCGDGVRQDFETCEGSDLGGQRCADLPQFDMGQLACTSRCALDTRLCTRCGDGLRQGEEACDGNDLGERRCSDLGFLGGGTLACSGRCGFDTSRCLACPRYTSSSQSPLDGRWSLAGPPGGNASALLALGGGVVLAGTGFTRGTAGASPGGDGSAIYRSSDGGQSFSLRKRFKNSSVRGFTRAPGRGRLYAGVGSLSGAQTDSSDDGVWISNDEGDTWSKDNAGLFPFPRVRVVIAAPGSPERIYLMIEGSSSRPLNAIPSLYRADAGGDWVKLPMKGVDQVTGGPALAMAVDPGDRDRLLLANGDRLFLSVDGGNSFTQAPFGAGFGPNGLRWVSGLYASPLNPKQLVLTTHDRELFQSLDGGKRWSALELPAVGQTAVAFTQDHLYVATRGQGLQRSADATGHNFTRFGNCLADPVPSSLAIDPTNASQIFLGFYGQGVLHRSGQAEIFVPQASGLDDLAAHVRVTGPASAPVAWIVSGAGLHRSRDGGVSWERIADQAGSLAFSAIAQDPADAKHLLAGTNGDWYQGSGTSIGVLDIHLDSNRVVRSNGLSGRTPGIIGLAFDPLTPGRAFAYQQGSFLEDPARVPTGLFASQDSGSSFSLTPVQGVSLASSIWFSRRPLEMGDDGGLLIGLRTDPQSSTVEVWRTTDGGASHSVIWSGTTNGPYAGIYLDPTGNLYLAGPSPTGLKRSTNGGADFVDFGVGLSGFSAMVRDLTFTPSGGLLVGTVDGVYYAADGLSFVELNQGFEAHARGPEVTSVSVIPGSPNIALVGSTEGVYWRTLP